MPISGGDLVVADLGGGGGWGDPLKRDPEMVLADVLDEYVSIASAEKDYGVVIDHRQMVLDRAATEKLRSKIKAEAEMDVDVKEEKTNGDISFRRMAAAIHGSDQSG